MEKQMNTNAKKEDQSNDYFRFQVFQGSKESDGKVKKTKTVGMAYLKAGQSIMTLRLWMFSWDRYYILPHKTDSGKYLIMTREPNKSPNAKNKYYWNIVGSGVVNSAHGIIEAQLDLLDKVFYVSTHPETSAHSVSLPIPDGFIDDAA